MRSLNLAGIELRRLTGERMARAALAVIALVPLLYGVLYLWAFWDPYTLLDKLPVALVNADKAVTVDGTRISAGDDLTDKLLERGTLGWHEVSLHDAEKGLADGRYYMALEIPEGFSANLGTANSAHPVRARLRVVDHESANMLATQIGGRVFTEQLSGQDLRGIRRCSRRSRGRGGRCGRPGQRSGGGSRRIRGTRGRRADRSGGSERARRRAREA